MPGVGGKDGCQFNDGSGLCWPKDCAKVPPPEKNWFATNSEMVPCFKLTKPMFAMVKKKQDGEETVAFKCAWDFVLCFLFACYPGLDPTSAKPAGAPSEPAPGR